MVDNLDQTERVDRELNVVKRARFNQTIETRETNEVPEPKFGVEPHTVKELPALPVRERQHENMLLHQQLQDNMLDEEVVSFGQRAQQQQEQQQQQLQLRQHNIPHNPVSPKQHSNECSILKGILNRTLVNVREALVNTAAWVRQSSPNVASLRQSSHRTCFQYTLEYVSQSMLEGIRHGGPCEGHPPKK